MKQIIKTTLALLIIVVAVMGMACLMPLRITMGIVLLSLFFILLVLTQILTKLYDHEKG